MIAGMEDRQYEKYKQRSDRTREKMMTMTKNEKPVFQEPVKPIDRLYAFDQMDAQRFIFENGTDAYMREMFEVDKIRRRLGGSNATRPRT
ncbi:hypothetical protein LCGC14_3144150 [marine sediment metagenome]|uniref:Uncharacterized protein n=1 Tax=marine sediment metagenome TaxID=412755 RepID=A0A0F8Y2X4_9ZZZZ